MSEPQRKKQQSPEELIAVFLESRGATCNAKSQGTYRAYLRPFAAWLNGRSISALSIQSYIADMRSRKLANATIGDAYRIIKTLCRYLVEYDLLESDPFVGPGRVKPPAQKRKRRKVYTDEQVVRLLVTAEAWIAEREEIEKWWPSKNPYTLRDARQGRSLVLLLCDSALRAAEVCGLSCGQIREQSFIVLGKGGHEDEAFMSEITRSALLDLAGTRADDEPLFRDKFLHRCTTRALRKCLKHLAERANVPLVPRPLHAFRHLAAREWLKAGLGDLAIQQLMRHANLATTRLYTDLSPAELAEIHGKASPIARWMQAARDASADDDT